MKVLINKDSKHNEEKAKVIARSSNWLKARNEILKTIDFVQRMLFALLITPFIFLARNRNTIKHVKGAVHYVMIIDVGKTWHINKILRSPPEICEKILEKTLG